VVSEDNDADAGESEGNDSVGLANTAWSWNADAFCFMPDE